MMILILPGGIDMHRLPYETLRQVYEEALKYSLDPEFIQLLEKELERRERGGAAARSTPFEVTQQDVACNG